LLFSKEKVVRFQLLTVGDKSNKQASPPQGLPKVLRKTFFLFSEKDFLQCCSQLIPSYHSVAHVGFLLSVAFARAMFLTKHPWMSSMEYPAYRASESVVGYFMNY